MVADLIEARVSAVKGYCDEPFLVAIASPTILLDRYTQGWTMAESFYAASRFVGWEDIVIGDPIMAPYAGPNAFASQRSSLSGRHQLLDPISSDEVPCVGPLELSFVFLDAIDVRIATVRAFFAVAFFVLGWGAQKGRADDWPHYRGPSRDGISKEKHWTDRWPESGPPLLWKTNVGIGFSSMAIS